MNPDNSINSIIQIIGGVPFLNIYVDDDYDEDKHDYIDTHQVLINITEISSIEEYAPDDEAYKGTNGAYITMKNEDWFVTMEYSLNELLQKISDAGYGNDSYDEY